MTLTALEYKAVTQNISALRADKMMTASSIPNTVNPLIEDITYNLPLHKDSSIAVLFTIEWAIYLKQELDQTDITVIVDADDRVVRNLCKYFGFDYIVYYKGLKMKEFDIVVGNPPYNSDDNSSKKLWPLFVLLATDIVKADGTVAMLTPTSWFYTPTNQKFKTVANTLIGGKLEYVNLDVNNYFKVGEDIGYFVWNKKSSDAETEFVLGDVTKTVSWDGQKVAFNEEDELKYSIINKFLNSGTKLFKGYQDRLPNGNKIGEREMLDNGTISETKTDVYDTELFWSGGKVRYTKAEYVIKGWKMLFSRSGYFTKYLTYSDTVGAGQLAGAIPFNSEQECVNTIGFLKSSLYTWYMDGEGKTNGWNDHFRRVPQLDATKSWSDADVFAYFGLTDEEIEYVKNNI